MVARIFSLDEKKALNRLKAFKCMVGRERFERSTSGLKVIVLTISQTFPTTP